MIGLMATTPKQKALTCADAHLHGYHKNLNNVSALTLDIIHAALAQ